MYKYTEIIRIFVAYNYFRITKIRIAMGKWNCFFLQRMGTDQYNVPYPVCESVATWDVWCKDIPFKVFDKVKEPAKRTWFDEHGDDEYIPENGLYLDAYTMKVQFGCKKVGNDSSSQTKNDDYVRQHVGTFLEYLRSAGMMKMYCTHTKIGRQNVRLSSVSDSATWVNEDGQTFLVFEVEFKVNDPKTDITLST